MKKTLLFGLVAVMTVSSANAGLWERLFGADKVAEPTTLEEACNTDEITKVCPEIILGQKTLIECLTENIKELSTKCATFVKKSVSEGGTAVMAVAADAKDAASEKAAAAQGVTTEKVQEIKDEVVQKVTQAKVAIAEKLLETAEKNAAANPAAAAKTVK